MADELSLLFKVRGDAAGAKQAVAETRAAIAALRSQTSSDFNAMQAAGKSALSGIGDNLNLFVGQRIPLVGGAFVRLTENVRGFGGEVGKGEKELASLNKTIDGLAQTTGKSNSQILNFLTSFVQIEGQAKRDAFAIEQFGAATASTLIPELEKAGEELSAVVASSEAAGASIGGLAVPIAVAVAAIAGMTLGAIALTKELFDLAKATAAFEGKLFDLSQQTGVSVETLNALEITASKTGGSIDSVAQSLVIFQGKLDEAQDPASKTAALFAELGISTDNTEQSLREAFAALAKMPEGFKQTNDAAELFGRRGGKQFLAIIKETNGDLDSAVTKLGSLARVTQEEARVADEFNDNLRDLSILLRGLGNDIIPAALDVLKDLSQTLKENESDIKVVAQAAGILARVIGTSLIVSIAELAGIIKSVNAPFVAFAEVLERIAKAAGAIKPVDFQGALSTAITVPVIATTTAATQAAQPNAQQLQQQSEILKAANEEAKRLAAQRIAEAEAALTKGNITRRQEVEAVITANKEKLDSDKTALQAEIDVQKARLAKDADNVDAIKKVAALEQQIRNAQTIFDTETAKKRADLQAQERKDLVDHEARKLDILLGAGEARIKVIQAQVETGNKTVEDGNKEIEAIENAGFKARKYVLERELALAGQEPAERQKIVDALAKLDQEQTDNAQKQAERRAAITRKEAQGVIDLQLAQVDTIIKLGDISAQRQIAAIQNLADERVKREEKAAKEILAIRLAAIDRETDAVRARLTAAQAITDPQERAKREAELNNQLRILTAEREGIQEEGDRNIEEGRRKDLANARRYADELIRIQRETARTVIDLLILHHAKREDIIDAQADFDIADENDRHKRELERLKAIKADDEAIEAEAERHQLELLRIAKESAVRKGEARLSPTSAFDQLRTAAAENLTGTSFTAAIAAIDSIRGAFEGLGQAVGQVVEAYVLYGKAGASVRQITAQILASVAQQAAVKAIFELAEGFAALALAYFGVPNAGPSASAHFTAAAIYGSIAGVAAVVGRGIAGNSFSGQQGATGGTRSSGPQGLQTIETGRNQPIRIVIHQDIRHDEGVIVRTWTDDYNKGGLSRETIANDGK